MCDTFVVVQQDRVLFAKNSDRDANEAQLLEWHSAQHHPANQRLRCTWIDIPQVGYTHAVLISRPFWMWGAEMGANEHGVVIGNEAVFTREPYAEAGLTGMDLVRLGLERGATAAEAVEQIVELLETHGQGGGCGYENRRFTYHNSFLVADAQQAIVLETAGRHWVTETVSHGVRSISNGLTITDFARRYADPLRGRVAACDVRRMRTSQLASEARGVADMMRALRDHGAGHDVPRYRLLNGGMHAPCMHAGGWLAASQTTASWVAEITADHAAHWVTGTSAPCTSLFKPVDVEQPLDLGPPPTDRADAHSLWWRGERLHRATMRDPARLWPLFVPQRDRLEQRWIADPPDPEEALVEADRWLNEAIAKVEAEPAADTRPFWVRRYWAKRNRLAGFPPPAGGVAAAAAPTTSTAAHDSQTA